MFWYKLHLFGDVYLSTGPEAVAEGELESKGGKLGRPTSGPFASRLPAGNMADACAHVLPPRQPCRWRLMDASDSPPRWAEC